MPLNTYLAVVFFHLVQVSMDFLSECLTSEFMVGVLILECNGFNRNVSAVLYHYINHKPWHRIVTPFTHISHAVSAFVREKTVFGGLSFSIFCSENISRRWSLIYFTYH